ncbi:Prohormone-1 [Armadillidium vulgare]|nr:Prohormone-1 [Armadillidium vulgare]
MLLCWECYSKKGTWVLTALVWSANLIVEDDGSMDAALLNYLFAKQMIERLSNGRDISELQQKRSYWKQCAFNAVSCFGRRNGDITMEKANFEILL